MKTIVLALLGVAGSLVLMAVAVAAVGVLDARPPASRELCDKLAQQGNYKDAYDGYRALALDPKDDPTLVGRDLQQAISCLMNLGRVDEIDAFREAVIEVHSGNWRLIQAAAAVLPERSGALRFPRRRQVPSWTTWRGRTVRHRAGARSGPGLAASGSGTGSRAVEPRSPRGGPLSAHARRGPALASVGRRVVAVAESDAPRCPA